MAASKAFLYPDAVAEHSVFRYEADLLDPDGAPVPAASVTAFLLTLRDYTTDQIINGREDVDVLNVNGGSVVDGHFSFESHEDDTSHFGIGKAEKKVMTLDLRLTGGGRVTHEVTFYVRNLRDISSPGSPGSP